MAASALAIDPIPGSAWVTDGLSADVRALARDGNTLYLGGNFDYVGPNTGGGARLDPVSGAASEGAPYVEGSVLASVADGAGGFYVGGDFTAIGGVVQRQLAHIAADGSLDRTFRPVLDGTVRSIVRVGGAVYVAGEFTHVDGQARGRLAAFDAATGALLAWAPTADARVSELSPVGSLMYLRGGFGSINGQERHLLAAVDLATGAATEWNPIPWAADNVAQPVVTTMVATPGAIFVGGLFNSIGGEPRRNLAALDPGTSRATSWIAPTAGASAVNDIAVDGTNVYVAAADRLYAVPVTDGSEISWQTSTNLRSAGALSLDGDRLYVGGSFEVLGGVARHHVAAVDPASGEVLSWNPSAGSGVGSFAAGGGWLYVGGGFNSVGGVARKNLAALDLTTGRATSWNPGADAPVESLALSDGSVFAGGWFATVGGEARKNLAGIDAATGTVSPWKADADGAVQALAVRDSTLYAGGSFTTVGGAARSRAAALDTGTGQVTPWNPAPDGEVHALALGDDEVYLGGIFAAVGGQARSRLAAVGTDGALRTWNPAVTGTALATGDNPTGKAVVRSLAATTDRVYVGGDFDAVGGESRFSLAAVAPDSGAVAPWAGQPSGSVQALVVAGDRLIAGGRFTSLAPRSHNGLAAYDTVTGQEDEWTPIRNPADISALAVSGTSLVAGGYQFTQGLLLMRDYERRNGLAVFDTALPTSWGLPGVDGTAVVGATVTCVLGSEWTGAPSQVDHQWYVDDVAVSGATGSTYLVTAGDAGRLLRCRVTATNGAGPTRLLGVRTRVDPNIPTAPSSSTSPSPTTSTTASPSSTPSAPLTGLLGSLTMPAPTVQKYPTKVVERYRINRTADVRLKVQAPGRRLVQVAHTTAAAGPHAISWNRRIYGQRARVGVRYRLVLTSTAAGTTVTRVVYVRL